MNARYLFTTVAGLGHLTRREPCPECKGYKSVPMAESGGLVVSMNMDCPTCERAGTVSPDALWVPHPYDGWKAGDTAVLVVEECRRLFPESLTGRDDGWAHRPACNYGDGIDGTGGVHERRLAVVATGTVAEVLPVVDGSPRSVWVRPAHVVAHVTGEATVYRLGADDVWTSHALDGPFDWSPGHTALRLVNVQRCEPVTDMAWRRAPGDYMPDRVPLQVNDGDEVQP